MVFNVDGAEADAMAKLRKQTSCKKFVSQFTGGRKKIKMLLAALGSVRIGKNCDLGLENAALGLRPSGSIFKTSVTVFPYTDLPAGQ